MADEATSVLLLARELYTRGRCLYTLRLARSLEAQGFAPLVAAARVCPLSRAALPRNASIELPSLGTPVLDWFARRTLLAECEEQEVEIVHAQSRLDWPLAEWLARKLGVPAVLTVHDFLSPRESLRFRPVHGGRIIAVSPSVKADLVQRTGIAPDMVKVIPIGIEIAPEETSEGLEGGSPSSACNVLPPVTASAPAASTTIAPPPSSTGWGGVDVRGKKGSWIPVVGTIGALEPLKGQEIFLRAAKQVLDRGLRAEFLVCGLGPEESRLRRLAGELGLLGRLTFVTSPVPLADVLAAMSVFVLPSLQQGLGSIMFEAMAQGKPVVSTKVGGAGEVFTHGQSGLYVPPNSVEGLANAIAEMLSDPARARRIGAAGREVIEREFPLETMVQQTVGVYKKLLARKATALKAAA